jgi:hypothetical protein
MIPVGYMFKTVSPRPDWLKAAGVADIYSLSGCVSEYFTDYIDFWKHNGYWRFDSPAIMRDIAAKVGLDLSQMTLFYYEAFDEEFDGDAAAGRGLTQKNLFRPMSRRQPKRDWKAMT